MHERATDPTAVTGSSAPAGTSRRPPTLRAVPDVEVDDLRALHDADADRYRLTMELAAVGISHVGIDGRFLEVNQAMCDLLGYSREELLQLGVYGISFPDDIAVTDDVRARLHSGEISSFQQEKRYLRKDGSVVWVDLKIGVRRGADGRVLYDITVCEDITDRRRTELALRASEARFKQLTELSSDWYWETDTDGRLVRLEGAKMRKWVGPWRGLTTDELGFEPMSGGVSIDELIAARSRFRDHLISRVIDGRRLYGTISGEPIYDEHGRFRGFSGVTRDVTRRIESEDQIRYLATHDSLTHLPNRMMFAELLAHALGSVHQHDERLAIGFIDLDRFKTVNDSLGHAAGDQLLRQIADRLRASVTDGDVVARLGGDEFVVMFDRCGDDDDIADAVRGVLDAVHEPIQLGEHDCRISTSIGIACYPEHGLDAATLMRNADLAMYAAKDAGKDQFRFFEPAASRRSRNRFDLEARLRDAIDGEALSLQYQPRLDLTTGRVSGVEALLRWEHPELGDVPPMQFIPVAEETGLILPIGRWVLRTACRQAVEWQRAGLPPIRMAVNISPRQFSDRQLVDDVASVLAGSALDPTLLELEITESAVMHDPDQAARILASLKGLGARVAIDDFGTGYSSLAQLRRFPLDILKIDQLFVSDLALSERDRTITEAIIVMGRTLGLTVVAEGVETAEQLAFLADHSCDEVQGFHLSCPLGAEEFAAFMAAR